MRVIRGKKDGPTVFISAAIHGDELNGIEIIRRIRKLKILSRLKGTLILVPIVNVYGIMTLSRYLPDRRDLNRSFPGSTRGSLASRVAKIFFDEIVSKCDLGIDLHTASIHKSNLPQVRTNLNNEYTFNLAKAFEAPVVLHSELRDGSLRAVAQDRGIPILLYEAGEALRFDETSIRIGVKGIINVLRENGMLPKVQEKKRQRIPVVTRSSQWIRASESGMIRTIKALGDTVQKDEIIAYIDEPLDNNTYEIRSVFDGIIIGKSEIPLVQEGDAVFHIAKFKNLETAENKIEYFSEDAIEYSEFHELNNEEIIE
ncbi:succinylglutamate desuccinylase [Candidatus Marinarcus aquaticus]|uniref:Succinylglutamate desuccinylase n=1 Tax=Candidatus Marinarcus aquaticus TaxID=2044504 RepID=A0A4V1LNN7_9BACT|nr:succinylglutamate desuccinylase [Candidatus Marinarcus aquaticus]